MSVPFTVPLNFAEEIDSRPLVSVLMDVSEPVGLLNSRLTQLAQETNITVGDQTVQYIANSLLTNALSPHKSTGGGSRQLSSFFHREAVERVKDIIDEVNDAINREVSITERNAEALLGSRIYPCEDLNSLRFRQGNVASVMYRIGPNPLDVMVEDDIYSDLDIDVRLATEEIDDELCDEIEVVEHVQKEIPR